VHVVTVHITLAGSMPHTTAPVAHGMLTCRRWDSSWPTLCNRGVVGRRVSDATMKDGTAVHTVAGDVLCCPVGEARCNGA
jgi:hypothetical protein